jgi:hypothetical protein
MLEANGANLLLGRGKVYFDRFDSSGNKTGLRFVGEAGKMELSPSVQTKERFTYAKNSSIKIAKNVTQQTHELNIELNEYTADNIALALLGDSVLLTQTTSSVVAEAIPWVAKNNRIYKTAKRLISAVIVKKAGTPGVLGTDFAVQDDKLGLVQIITGGVFADGDSLTVDYTAGAIAAPGLGKVNAGTLATIDGYLAFVGDPANGPAYDGEFWRCRINPNGALALITDDYGAIPLQFEVLDDTANHPTEPLYRLIKRG